MNKKLVQVVSLYFPEVNDCSSFDGIGMTCMESKQIVIVEEDMEEWTKLSDVFFDVVLVDAAMSQQKKTWLGLNFFRTISDVLQQNDGIVNVNVGNPPRIGTHTAEGTNDKDRDDFFRRLTILVIMICAYDEPSVNYFSSAFAFLFRDEISLSYKRFLRTSPAAFDLDMIERFRNSEKIVPTLLYDGPTHLTYKVPSRAWENWYCQNKIGKHMVMCQEFLPHFYDPINRVAESTIVHRDSVKGRGLYAVKDIAKGTWINSDDTALQIAIDGTLWEALHKFVEEYPDATMYKGLRDWIVAYGFENESTGNTGWSASIANINTFTNHACDDSSENAGVFDFGFANFDLVMTTRNYLDLATAAKRDISAGEEGRSANGLLCFKN